MRIIIAQKIILKIPSTKSMTAPRISAVAAMIPANINKVVVKIFFIAMFKWLVGILPF